ncbi:response regulator [Cohnella candidum]|uniref:Response regulator n=1 Tax=Cohnella candidum TaxID=2674991 RepID=A0A3G3JXQ9_9BACL|nr:response regulator [Cohnella candidum]
MARILIVDDSVIMRRNLKSMLVQAGHTIVGEASDGMEAYREYSRLIPDLVTMDITMPVMNGIDAVKKIMATYPDANIIMISALDQRNMVFEAIQNGAKHYILKPVTVEKILETVNEVLKIKSSDPHGLLDESGKQNDVPLAIENKNGIFLIRIGSGIGDEKLDELQTAVQGFLFVKPLRVVVDFGGIGMLQEELLLRILGLMRKLHDAGGAVKALSHNHNLIESLKQHNPDSFFRIHTEWAQVVF